MPLCKYVLLTMLFALNAQAGQLYVEFPASIDAGAKYVFYTHGYIVEGDNPKPEHPRFGVYDFPAIKDALADESYNLIAYHRPAKTNPREFAKKLADDVRQLIDGGVKPANITLLGFSRGGAITAFASNELRMKNLNTIIMAGCSGWIPRRPEVVLAGRVLSIYESSDRVGSCQSLIDRSKGVTSFEEVIINTGKEHGAFFTPRPEWLEPVKRWIGSESG